MTTVESNVVYLPANRGGAVVPGVVDSRAITTFTCGQCHSFALALHDQTGWPIFGARIDPYDGIPDHFMCYDADNDRYVDIEGCWTKRQVISQYKDITPEPTDPQNIEEWVDYNTFYPLHTDVAATFVQPVLDAINNA